MALIASLIGAHNVALVALAAFVCLIGAWVSFRLLMRAQHATGGARFSWLFMVGVAAGASIWCTHFVAIIAYSPGVSVSFAPVATAASLMIAIAGCFLGALLAVQSRVPLAWELGGLLVGATIAVMHFTGMTAYVMDAGRHQFTYASTHVAAAIGLSLLLGLAAFTMVGRTVHGWRVYAAAGLLGLGIVSLHFGGMAAMHDPVLCLSGFQDEGTDRVGLSFAIAAIGLLVVGTGLASSFLDSRTRSEAAERIRHLVDHDPLTALGNRSWFTRHAGELLAAAAPGQQFACVVMNLDNFREVNDLWGNAEGDKALQVLARRLRSCLHADEVVARVGGDEFAVLKAIEDHGEVPLLIGRLQASLALPLSLPGGQQALAASFGISLCPADAGDIEVLLNNADLAMQRAKNLVGERTCFYDAGMDELVRRRRSIVRELHEALRLGQFEIHYQVQKSVRDRRVVGYEALLRWRHPERGLIPPMDFIPLAEESGLIVEIGEWVLRQACLQAARWPRPYKVAVNVSPLQLQNADLPVTIARALADTGLAASRLEIEVTESTLMTDADQVVRLLRAIRALGVSVAMDDFGTGYSSLSTLSLFPFDRLKLDKSFIAKVERSAQERAIVQAVLALGNSLGIPVLAEGVEREEQMTFLREQGCDEVQGYLLGRPQQEIQVESATLHLIENSATA